MRIVVGRLACFLPQLGLGVWEAGFGDFDEMVAWLVAEDIESLLERGGSSARKTGLDTTIFSKCSDRFEEHTYTNDLEALVATCCLLLGHD